MGYVAFRCPSYASGIRASVLFAVVASCTVLVTAAAARDESGACTSWVREPDGSMLYTFCGPAQARFRVDDQTFRVKGGRCQFLGGSFTVNIGKVGSADRKPRDAYFGIEVRPPTAGTHTGQLAALAIPGKRYSLPHATVTVQTSFRGGRFSGGVPGGGTAGGSFSC